MLLELSRFQAQYLPAIIIMVDGLVYYFHVKTNIPYKLLWELKVIFKMQSFMGLCILGTLSRNTSNTSQIIKHTNLISC